MEFVFFISLSAVLSEAQNKQHNGAGERNQPVRQHQSSTLLLPCPTPQGTLSGFESGNTLLNTKASPDRSHILRSLPPQNHIGYN